METLGLITISNFHCEEKNQGTGSARKAVLIVLQQRPRLLFSKTMHVCWKEFLVLWLNLQIFCCKLQDMETNGFHRSWLIFQLIHRLISMCFSCTSKSLQIAKISSREEQETSLRMIDSIKFWLEAVVLRKTHTVPYTWKMWLKYLESMLIFVENRKLYSIRSKVAQGQNFFLQVWQRNTFKQCTKKCRGRRWP